MRCVKILLNFITVVQEMHKVCATSVCVYATHGNTCLMIYDTATLVLWLLSRNILYLKQQSIRDNLTLKGGFFLHRNFYQFFNVQSKKWTVSGIMLFYPILFTN